MKYLVLFHPLHLEIDISIYVKRKIVSHQILKKIAYEHTKVYVLIAFAMKIV